MILIGKSQIWSFDLKLLSSWEKSTVGPEPSEQTCQENQTRRQEKCQEEV